MSALFIISGTVFMFGGAFVIICIVCFSTKEWRDLVLAALAFSAREDRAMTTLSPSTLSERNRALILLIIGLLPMLAMAIYYHVDRGFVVVPWWWKSWMEIR